MRQELWRAVRVKLEQVAQLWDGSPARVRFGEPASSDDIAIAKREAGRLPPEYGSFLRTFDGAHLFPWTAIWDGGLRLHSATGLALGNEYAYISALDDPGPGHRPFYIVGEIVGTGNYIGMDRQGVVWYLDHEYGMDEWVAGRGQARLGSSLEESLYRFVEYRGELWWQKRRR